MSVIAACGRFAIYAGQYILVTLRKKFKHVPRQNIMKKKWKELWKFRRTKPYIWGWYRVSLKDGDSLAEHMNQGKVSTIGGN